MVFNDLKEIITPYFLNTININLKELQSTVYFLLKDEECVYVGFSHKWNIFKRIGCHVSTMKNERKDFNRALIINVKDKREVCYVESFFIAALCPKYNKQYTYKYQDENGNKQLSDEYIIKSLKQGTKLINAIEGKLNNITKNKNHDTSNKRSTSHSVV